MRNIYIAPAPAGKMNSSWNATHVLGDGSFVTANPNQ